MKKKKTNIVLLPKYTQNGSPNGMYASIVLAEAELGLYNAVKFILGHFTDVHNGELCAEIIPANMRIMSLTSGHFLSFPP